MESIDIIRFFIELIVILAGIAAAYWQIKIKLKELELRIESLEKTEERFNRDFTKLEEKLEAAVDKIGERFDATLIRLDGVATKLEVVADRVNNLMTKP